MLALSLIPVPGRDAAEASCAAPSLLTDGGGHPALSVGDSVEVRGRAFVVGCNDTGSVSEGPFGCGTEVQHEEETPMSHVPLLLKQGGTLTRLAVADAGRAADSELGQVTWTFRLPPEARPGRAVLVADVPPAGADRFDARLVVRITR